MYLKQLDIQGFKSFPDKVKITFDRGVTAIVGPNGSGKSNISDAIRWVLGEMSPKNMRGGKMEDVIFNGTSTRRQASFSEVTMVLDNTDRKLMCEEDSVFVARRLYRSGESEYLINKKTSRLKDIVELFLNTGIGKEGYSVIGQGKISEIISQKSDERRGIFEEAAGISKYKYRKNEAQKKLSLTAENQLRIYDILSEIEKRIPILEKQSEKAKKYREYTNEKKNIEVSLWYDRIKSLKDEKKSTEESYNIQKNLLDKITERIEVCEGEIDKTYLSNQKLNVDASKIQDKLNEITREQGEISAKISVLENDIGHYKKNCDDSKMTFSATEKSLSELIPQREELLKEYNEKVEINKSISEEEKNFDDKIIQLNQFLLIITAKKNAKNEEIKAFTESINQNELAAKSREGFEKARQERLLNINVEIENLASQALLIKEENLKKESAKSEILNAQIEDAAHIDEQTEKTKNINTELEALYEDKQKKRLKFLENNQRRETLKRMERLLEGYSGSVKEVMNAAFGKVLFGIHNPVSKIIQTDEKYVIAIETVLGNKMQSIVCESDESAKSAINFLKRTNSGRATFMPINTVSGTKTDTREVKNMAGYIGLACDVCRSDKVYSNIVMNLLGRIIVADNIDNATLIARKLEFRVKIVTLDGQIINAGGSFTGGQIVGKTGILSRNRDISILDEDIAKTENEISFLAKEIEKKEDEKKQLTDNIREWQRELSVSKERLLGIESDLKIEKNRFFDIDRRISELELEKSKITGNTKTVDDEMRESVEKTAVIKKDLENAKSEYESYEEKYNETFAENEKLQKERTSFLISKETLLGELIRHSEKLTSLSVLINNTSQAHEFAKKSLIALENDINNAIKEREESQIALEELNKSTAIIKEEHKKTLDTAEDTQRLLFDLRAKQKVQNIEKESVLQLCTTLKSKLDTYTSENDTLISRLWEEYEFTFTDAESYVKENLCDGSKKEKSYALSEIKAKIKQLGAVNMEAVEQYEKEKERFEFITGQYNDIENAKKELEKLINSIEVIMREMFVRTFDMIKESFKETFAELFGGGYGEIALVDNGDILDCGIDINIQPPGKVIKNLSLLSGGEQAFVAIALYFAILNVNPAPFCVFDEIEAALDDSNVYRFGEYMKKYTHNTQFIIITHRRGTMEAADILYGVTMQEKGVTDFLKIDFNQIDMKGFKIE